MKTPKERDNLDLLELVCELHTRSWTRPSNKGMHDAYIEARQELESRLQVKTCNLLHVSKCDGIEREALLLASFLDWLESVSENSVDREWIQDYFKSKQ